jgi:hypothetical protein
MRTISNSAALAALLALVATPAFAGPPSDTPNRENNPGADNRPAETPPANKGTLQKPATPGPKADQAAKAKAYGRHCQDQSKKRSDAADGTKGTPFSQCVTAMARLAKGTTDSPREACRNMSKKHTKGEKGTPFSRCVVEGAKLLRQQRAESR